jgi:hypothetical protein
MKPIIKYPRTPHLLGSRLQHGDEDLAVVSPFELDGRFLVVEEKLDGANSAISFDADSGIILQSRGHVLSGGPRERQFDLFKRWANAHRDEFWRVLGNRYIVFGEWLYARHTIPYDSLPHFFLEFDVLDRETDEFLSTHRRHELFAMTSLVPVPVLSQGPRIRFDDLIGRSAFSSTETMEGLYIKWEKDDRVCGRYKFVRGGFTQAVEEEGVHWIDRPLEPNLLRAGVDIFADLANPRKVL